MAQGDLAADHLLAGEDAGGGVGEEGHPDVGGLDPGVGEGLVRRLLGQRPDRCCP